jgi:hypothetical protein
LSDELAIGFEALVTEPERIHRLTRFAQSPGMTAPEADHAALEILTDPDVVEINKVIVTPTRRVRVNEVDDE